MVCENCGAVMSETDPMELIDSDVTCEADFEDTIPTEDRGKTLGIIGLAVGAASLLLAALYPCTSGISYYVTPIVSIPAIILSITAMMKSKKSGHKNTFAIFGLMEGIASTAVSGGYLLCIVAYVVASMLA